MNLSVGDAQPDSARHDPVALLRLVGWIRSLCLIISKKNLQMKKYIYVVSVFGKRSHSPMQREKEAEAVGAQSEVEVSAAAC